MPKITLPDGSKKEVPNNTTLYDIAKDISNSLVKVAVAGKINGKLKDLSVTVEDDCSVEIIKKSDAEGIEIVRHSFAHLIGHAIKQLYPDAKMAIGPVIKNGFYYDIDCDKSLNEDELILIENKIKDLIKKNYEVIKKVVTRQEALKVFLIEMSHINKKLFKKFLRERNSFVFSSGIYRYVSRPTRSKYKIFKTL